MACTRERNAEVVRRVSAGEKQAQVARDMGLSRSRVYTIMKRETYRAELETDLRRVALSTRAFYVIANMMGLGQDWRPEQLVDAVTKGVHLAAPKCGEKTRREIEAYAATAASARSS